MTDTIRTFPYFIDAFRDNQIPKSIHPQVMRDFTLTMQQMTKAITVSGNPTISFSPVGNSPSTLASFVVSANTASSATRQFLGAFGLVSNSGHGTVGADKVALYAATVGKASSSDIWAFNTVTTMNSDFPSDSIAQGYECDFNNNQGHRGDVNVAPPSCYGLAITGAGAFRSTAAQLISGPGTSPIWNRGIVFANNCVSMHTIEDLTSAAVSYYDAGIHSVGIDLRAGTYTSQIGMALPNNTQISWNNVANSATIIDYVSNTNNRHVGIGASNVVVQAHLIPQNDNSTQLGGPSNRYTAVYAANGAIQTSDPSMKTEIAPLLDMLPVINDIDPITFKWKDGGNGKAGKRTHWGFKASDIKQAMDKINMDFGGYVKSDNIDMLRPDQLIPILWKAIQELTERLEAIENSEVAK